VPHRVYSPAAASTVSAILADRESRSETFGLESPLATPFWAAVKTGTSKDMRDNWCVGYSRRHTVAVWVGNFSGEPMRNVSGVTGAAPAWLELMSLVERGPVVARVDDTAPVHRPVNSEPGPRPSGPGRAPRIAWPIRGTVIAIDPDIPPSRQRVVFEARGGADVRWRLDAAVLGRGADRIFWKLEAGRHLLELVGD